MILILFLNTHTSCHHTTFRVSINLCMISRRDTPPHTNKMMGLRASLLSKDLPHILFGSSVQYKFILRPSYLRHACHIALFFEAGDLPSSSLLFSYLLVRCLRSIFPHTTQDHPISTCLSTHPVHHIAILAKQSPHQTNPGHTPRPIQPSPIDRHM